MSGLSDAIFGAGAFVPSNSFTFINRGATAMTIYAPDGSFYGIAPPGGQFPPPPGIYWKRIGGKSWRVDIWR